MTRQSTDQKPNSVPSTPSHEHGRDHHHHEQTDELNKDKRRQHERDEGDVDKGLEDTFPASDPPSTY